MTPDELETERTALVAEIDAATAAGRALSPDVQTRIAAVAAADAVRAKSPLEQAVRVFLDEASALTDQDPPPGLSIRDLAADPLEIVTATGELYTRIPKASLHDLEARLGSRRN